MPFLTDKQTLSDLNVQGKFKTGSMFNLFDRVKTHGGEKLLEEFFRSPLLDSAQINRRSAEIEYVQESNIELKIDPELMRLADEYIKESKPVGRLTELLLCSKEKVQELLFYSKRFKLQQDRIQAVQNMLNTARNLLTQLVENGQLKKENPCRPFQEQLNTILYETDLKQLTTKFSYTLYQTALYRYLIENKCSRALVKLLQILYKFDVYISVASVAANRQLTYAQAEEMEETDTLIQVKNLKHPALKEAVGNDLTLGKSKNLLFLTGANMAGKSTLMRALGVSFYLAHMGFPVAADAMSFTVMDGVYSSINVKDQIEKGWSHFYAEVMRMKQIVQKLTEGHRLFVLFDEMYKSTNVKDAYDATLAISQRLAQYNNCYFVVSTHIIEVGEKLRDMPTVMFRYLPTVMEGNVPRYTYNLTEGITNDRQGMIIIENEQIFDMLEMEEVKDE